MKKRIKYFMHWVEFQSEAKIKILLKAPNKMDQFTAKFEGQLQRFIVLKLKHWISCWLEIKKELKI